MKVACLSDTHGHLPEIPECDLLLLGGDYCPFPKHFQEGWFRQQMAPWLAKISEKTKVVGVAGNHDWIFELHPHLVPKMEWTYLQDSGTEFNGFKIWGTPWQPRFFDWAFNADEPKLTMVWDMIPDDTDILVLHGPPYGYGDKSTFRTNYDGEWPGYEHAGSPSLLKRIEAIKPKLVVAGHIHPGYGRYMIGESTVFINASYVYDANRKYVPRGDIQVVEL